MRAMGWLFTAVFAFAACGADAPTEKNVESRASSAEAHGSTVELTGDVIEVRMITDGEGNYYEPANFTAKRGDIVRFVLESGVHNVSFPARENPEVKNLPGPGPLLQLPGQTYDVTVDFDPGDYFYQCDPHAALGMVGTLTVTD